MAALGLVGCERSPVSDVRVTPFDTALDLSALEARHGGRIGLSAFNDDGRVTWRGGERFVYCSTFKMFLAAATLLRVQAGQERLDRAIPITAADMISHAPVTQPAVGTVEVSDNPAANILIREMGGLEAFRAFYRGIGDNSTRVDRLEPEMNRLDGDKDTITPIQSANNISRLLVSPNTPLDTTSKALLMRWLTDTPTGLGRIKAGVPAGWGVAHKTGTGGYGPVNDIGVIYPPSGEPVVIAIYFHAERTTRTAEAEAVIAEVTRLALTGLGLT
jgi:beta-lactamase class A